MPLENIDTDTFVAFVDISGFKKLMKRGKSAWKAMKYFYQNGYQLIEDQNTPNIRVEGIFVSDSAVLFIRNNYNGGNRLQELQIILDYIKELNKKMIERDYLLTTSIAFGQFQYQEGIEFSGIQKGAFLGNAYILAFSDHDNGRPKITPGQCRIVCDKLPQELDCNFEDCLPGYVVQKRPGDDEHYYYYWNLDSYDDIDSFERRYKNASNLIYKGILESLKNGNMEHNSR